MGIIYENTWERGGGVVRRCTLYSREGRMGEKDRLQSTTEVAMLWHEDMF